jgi:type VI secretion system protein ImpM
MPCGLYGKLPVKRDFIALHAPREFLNVWEPWIQSAVSASRESLGAEWQSAYLTAPIWRFWLGAELCGSTVTGAVMPSLDGLGRYFPLTVFACADDRAAIAPPDMNAHDDWYVAAEEFLLDTLGRDISFETIVASLEGLEPPGHAFAASTPAETAPLSNGFVAKVNGRPLPELFSAMRVADPRSYGAATYWWTAGGEGYQPFAMSGVRMPDPFLFTEMLTGRFALAFG